MNPQPSISTWARAETVSAITSAAAVRYSMQDLTTLDHIRKVILAVRTDPEGPNDEALKAILAAQTGPNDEALKELLRALLKKYGLK